MVAEKSETIRLYRAKRFVRPGTCVNKHDPIDVGARMTRLVVELNIKHNNAKP